jgi:two-component system, NtrC family, response regulator AtoC
MAANAVVMVVDDDAQLRSLVGTVLMRAGHDVVEAADGEEALRLLDEKLPDLILTDLAMPKMDGSQLIEEVRKRDPMLPMIILTGLGTVDKAVEMMRKGACDFITKPFKIDQLSGSVKKALGSRLFRRDVLRLRSEQCDRLGEVGATLIGASPQMIAVYRILKQVAHSPATTVLIQGESGTGKELIARAIHQASDCRQKCFMDINCAALTESLLEAEIFGYEKGAFTGAATGGKPGLFEVANGGTVFLDEIGEMSMPLQAKLLRVLQEKRFKRVGGVEDVEVDIRIIASTNRDLELLVQEGKFRLDLYYRLRVIPILVPPLRERKEDIGPIARHYVEYFSAQLLRKDPGLTPEALTALEAYSWPGNVRELRNVIERAVILSPAGEIGPESLLFAGSPQAANAEMESATGNLSIADMEKRLINKVLGNTSWRKAEAARILGINRTTLHNKIREYELAPGGARA